eukprot:1488548-Rhodomonas_salina.2
MATNAQTLIAVSAESGPTSTVPGQSLIDLTVALLDAKGQQIKSPPDAALPALLSLAVCPRGQPSCSVSTNTLQPVRFDRPLPTPSLRALPGCEMPLRRPIRWWNVWTTLAGGSGAALTLVGWLMGQWQLPAVASREDGSVVSGAGRDARALRGWRRDSGGASGCGGGDAGDPLAQQDCGAAVRELSGFLSPRAQGVLCRGVVVLSWRG